MTRSRIRRWFRFIVLYFIILILIGVACSVCDNSSSRRLYSTFKDLIPLFIAIPATWLGYCIQRRAAYLQHLRTIWTKLIDAVLTSAQYTYSVRPDEKEYSITLTKVSIVIDEIRGVFMNLGETESSTGLYPFEPLKDIYNLVKKLRFGDEYQKQDALKTREMIFALWRDVRCELLKEFDRESPDFSHSHWADAKKRRVYEDHGISV